MTTNTTVSLPCAVKKRRISFTAVVYALVVGSASLLFYFGWVMLSPGWFHTDRMNGIVEAVRRQQFGEEEVIFRVEDFSRPESLQRLQHSVMSPEPNVWARKKNGALQVAIITRDSGHIGEYGFVFSEVPVTATEFQGSTYYDVIGPMRELGGKVDDHWWRAANRDR